MRESNRRPQYRLAALSMAVLIACSGLTACGKSDVDGTGGDSATETSTTSASPRSSDGANPAQPSELSEDSPGPSTVMRTAQDDEYLQDLKNQGITVDGVEDSLIGTGKSLCQGKAETGRVDPVLARAVAGQLAQQGKASQDTKQTSTILTNTAVKHYCQ